MKRIIAVLFVFAIAEIGLSQSFDKGSRNFDLNLDFAAYKGKVTHNVANAQPSNSGAASAILSPQMEWATGKRISLGASLTYSYYLDSSKSASGKPMLNGLDANFIFNFHFLRKPKTDMMVGFKLGIAGIRYDPNDGTGDIYGSMGLASDLHFTARFYVSNRFGIIANLAFPKYCFNKFGKSLDDTYTINFGGICIGTGLAIKLSNQRTEGKQAGK